jgi:transforming growth factor-beta-induced protein
MKSAVLVPLVLLVAACNSDSPVEMQPMPNLVQVAQAVNAETGEFSVLISALTRAGLVNQLSTPGPFTVFAPTDAAFAALGLDATSVAALPVADLTQILLYHVVPGRLAAASVVSRTQLTTAGGGTAQIRLEGGTAFINNARIVATDVEASNGIIHVIDAVLLP